MRKFLSLFAAMLVAFVANAAVINITNGTPDALRIALGNAETGDIIEMAAGTYVESNSNYIAFDGKEVIVRAAEGAEVIIQPQVSITISNGAKAIFKNIKIDASQLNELADWYEHLIYAADASENQLVMDGCEIYNFLPNKSMIYCSSANTFSSIVFDECYFHNIMKSILFVENSSANISVSLTNSTIANISTNAESYWAGVMDVRAAGASLMVDHCTYYNVIPMNTDYSAVSKITLANGFVSNCIFMLPTAQDGIRAMRGVTATNCITFNYLKDSGTGIHSSVTQNNCVQTDPLFVDAANGDFTLGEGSPALTMNDGQPIGDPRWAAAAPVTPTLENGFYLVGSINEWTPAAEYHFVGNPDNNAEFMLNVTLAENDELKVVNVLDGNITAWFPGGDNYVVDAAHAGEKTVYFRPDYQGGEGWFAACIYIAPNAEPQPASPYIFEWTKGTGAKIETDNTDLNANDMGAMTVGTSVVARLLGSNAVDNNAKGYKLGNNDVCVEIQGTRDFVAGDTVVITGVCGGSGARAFAIAPITTVNAAVDTALTNTQENTSDILEYKVVVKEAQAGEKMRIFRLAGKTMYLYSVKVLPYAAPAEDPAKFYITGDAATVGESLAWNPAAIKSTEDAYTLALAAGEHKLKVTVDGTWNTAKGFSDLTSAADGLSADGDGNICFTLAEAGDVVVTYTAEAFTLAGNFYVEPQPQECDWDAIDFLGDGSPEQSFGNQFKVCKAGDQPNVVNIQTPNFAAETGIYVTFPSAAFGEISLAEGQYVIEGAGMVLYLSAFTEEYTEVTVNCEGNDIVFTVYNAAAAPQPAHTYTVAGSSDVAFGTAWDPSNTANDMVLVEGLYTWEKADLTLAAGSIGFKVCEDHAWTTAYPAQDYQLAIPEAGIYTITITFNADSKEVNAVATKTGSAVVLPTIAMHGNFLGSWADTENFTVAEGDATASLTLNLAAGNYEFGMRIGGSGNWTANGFEFSRENASGVIVAGSSNLKLIADLAGDYVFTWTYETNTLTITFPMPSAIDNTAVDAKAIKRIVNGQLFIEMNGVLYNAQGTIVR